MAENPNELVWAEKPGFPRKQFTRQQLSAMGEDEGEGTFNGWAIVTQAPEPDEVKEAKAKAAAEAKEKAEKAKADKAAAKSADEKALADKKAADKAAKAEAKAKPAEAPVVPLNPDQGDSGATKTDPDNGQITDNPAQVVTGGAENSDLGGSTTAPGGEGH